MFLTNVDIANRALQHCGVQRITDFNEDSLQASETSFCYDKLRVAELRRNVWRFAIRNAALRPIAAGTMFLSPKVWASTTTYGFGAIVALTDGTLWQSRAQDNLNNAPSNSAAWEVYCGPLTAQLYDRTGTTGYYAGELVYETPGDGTYTVYESMQSNNTQDPRSPSNWISTVQYSKDQVVLFYAAWAIGTTYAAGAGVSYSGIYYVSLSAGNVGNEPDTATTKWVAVTTTLSPAYYDSTVAYTVGQFVTYLGLNYVCIAASTGHVPTNVTYWAAQAVGTTYSSLIDFNLNNNPSSAPSIWSSLTTYAAGASVGGSDGNIYTSIGSGNINHDPTSTSGYWTNTGVLNPWTTVNPFGTANDLWLQSNASLTDLTLIYPLGAGPSTQSSTRNVYRLPANFLRRAPQDPKAGSVSFLGAPTGLMYDDWNLQGDYLVTGESQPIALRFVADISDVTSMDAMFCEGLAARVAYECVDRLTQSTAKRAAISAAYNSAITQARMVNGIETGATEPPEDEYLAVRL